MTMEEYRLDELFDIRCLDLRKAWMKENDVFYNYNEKTNLCSFFQPVILISTIKPITILHVMKQAEIFRRMFCLLNMATDIVLTKYVYYYLQGNKDFLERLYMGTTIENLSIVNLREFKIKIPSMAEQIAIVENMDVLEGIIENQSRALIEINDIFGAYYQRAYLVNGKYWGKKKLTSFTRKKIYSGHHTELEVMPKDNGVMVSLGRDIFLEVDRKNCNPYYLVAALQESLVVQYRKNGKWTDVSCSGLSISVLQNILVPLPPLRVQNDYEVIYKKISDIKNDMKNFTAKACELYVVMLFKFLYRDSMQKDIAQFGQAINRLANTLIKYSYRETKAFVSVAAYDVARKQQYEKLASGNITQVFDEKQGKIILMKV